MQQLFWAGLFGSWKKFENRNIWAALFVMRLVALPFVPVIIFSKFASLLEETTARIHTLLPVRPWNNSFVDECFYNTIIAAVFLILAHIIILRVRKSYNASLTMVSDRVRVSLLDYKITLLKCLFCTLISMLNFLLSPFALYNLWFHMSEENDDVKHEIKSTNATDNVLQMRD